MTTLTEDIKTGGSWRIKKILFYGSGKDSEKEADVGKAVFLLLGISHHALKRIEMGK